MKQGKYFRIPEGPADMERLWEEGHVLAPEAMPGWLAPEDAARYRALGSSSWQGLAPPEQHAYFAEVEELESVGLIAEAEPEAQAGHRLYVGAPDFDQIWSIGIYTGTSPFDWAPLEGAQNPVLTRAHVTDVPAVFVADPFMVSAQGAWHLFFEVMNWRTGKGEIGLATSSDAAHWAYQGIVLAEPFHLSYPYVFPWLGDYYMIPESYQAGSVRLYKAKRFPMEWSLVATLLTGPYLVDASIFRHQDKWWILADASPTEAHDTLCLFYADELTGPWREHPRSPVLAGNPRIARPAGRVLVSGGTLIRYAQNCGPAYGSDVRALAIDELTTTSYRERELQPAPILGPSGNGWNACGMHHVDAHRLDDGRWLACVDGWRNAAALCEGTS